MNINKKLEKYGLRSADILIPKKNVDLQKWAVVACDQYTSEKDYWTSLAEFVGTSPSTLNIIFPEVYLEEDGKEERIASINKTMQDYIESNLFDEYDNCFVLVERNTESGTRHGLMVTLDLEAYDYSVGSKTLIRATEGTILSRIPPRVEIRKNAPLELPHIMVLISDDKKKIIEPLIEKKDKLDVIYDTKLNKNGGEIKGFLVNSDKDMEGIYEGFKALYDSLDKDNPLLFAMGDGNHSLATAKANWEAIKKTIPEKEWADHPARYALVEIENIYDPGLNFEPIHRAFFGLDDETFDSILLKYAEEIESVDGFDMSSLIKAMEEPSDTQIVGVASPNGYRLVKIINPDRAIAAGTIQLVIDDIIENNIAKVDYIHGPEVALGFAKDGNNIGLILPPIYKENFFSDMLKDGAYPRKTFSIGHANEKRYYMEARKIR